ncbi:MAG: hypothetical protein ACRC7B_00980 [Metamycoplasmataceae bacterium]
MINNIKKMLLTIMIGTATIAPVIFVASYNVVLVDNNHDLINPNSLTKDLSVVKNINKRSDSTYDQNSSRLDELSLLISYDIEPIENENVELLKTKSIKHHSEFF